MKNAQHQSQQSSHAIQRRWENRYEPNDDQSLSWTESAQSLSQQWIRETLPRSSSIADIGAGRSMLLPALLMLAIAI